MGHPPIVGDAGLVDDLVGEVEDCVALLIADPGEEGGEVSGVHLTGIVGHTPRKVGGAEDLDTTMIDGLPNLIIGGAPKCGTSSLHYYLGLHPDVAKSRPKELNFFVAELNWELGPDWYASHFDRHARPTRVACFSCGRRNALRPGEIDLLLH